MNVSDESRIYYRNGQKWIHPSLEERKLAAQLAFQANRGEAILPRYVYELVGEPVPEGATDEIQYPPEPEPKRRFWDFLKLRR